MAAYLDFFVTNTTGAGGFSLALADNAGGPRWATNGAAIVTKTGVAFTWVFVSLTNTKLRLPTGNWGTAQAGDLVCLDLGGSVLKIAEVTAVSGTDLQIAGAWSGTPIPLTVRVGGVALTTSAAALKTYMQRILAGTYAATRAWRLNIHASGSDWAPPDIDSTLIGIGTNTRALTAQGFLAAAGDLSASETRPKFKKVGASASDKVMFSLTQPATQMRFYDLDFEFQPVTTGFAVSDRVSAILVSQPGYTFSRCKISVTATPNCPVQVVRLENARQTIRTCWIVRPATPQRIAIDGVRDPASCIFVTHTPDYFAFVSATILGNLLDGPDSGESAGAYYNCGIHVHAGSRHQIANNIFRKQPTGVLVERFWSGPVPTFPTIRFERNTLIGGGTSSYGVILKWEKETNAPFQDIQIANNLFVRINTSRAVGIISDTGKVEPLRGVLGYVGFNTFHDAPSALDAGLLFDTSEEHRFQSAAASLFVDEPNSDFRLAWPDIELGINSVLQVGGRLNAGSANFENRTDPGACAKQLF